MSSLLNILQPERHHIKLEIAGIELTVRPYNHGDTKAFLELLSDYKAKKKGGEKKLLLAQEELINACIIPDETGRKPIKARDLHRADFVALMVFLKNITHGEESHIRFQCSNKKCENPETKNPYITTIPFVFDDAVIKGERKEKISFDYMGKEVTIFTKPYTLGTMIQNAELFDIDIPDMEVIHKFQASFVDYLSVGDEVYEDIPFKDKVEFLTKLTPKYKKFLVSYIEEEPIYIWEKEWKCPICEAINIAIFDKVQDFFV